MNKLIITMVLMGSMVGIAFALETPRVNLEIQQYQAQIASDMNQWAFDNSDAKARQNDIATVQAELNQDLNTDLPDAQATDNAIVNGSPIVNLPVVDTPAQVNGVLSAQSIL